MIWWYVMALSDPSSEKEEELEPRPSDKNSMESPEAEDNAVPGHHGGWGAACWRGTAAEGQWWQQATDCHDEEQLLLLPDPWVWRAEQREAQRRLVRLPWGSNPTTHHKEYLGKVDLARHWERCVCQEHLFALYLPSFHGPCLMNLGSCFLGLDFRLHLWTLYLALWFRTLGSCFGFWSHGVVLQTWYLWVLWLSSLPCGSART